MTENQKALIIFICFMVAFGCAGNGDYEYAKHQEQKQMAALKRKNAALTLEMNQREDVLGLQADFEAILDDK